MTRTAKALALAAACAAAGCGGGGSKTDSYEGTWHYDNVAMASVDCQGTMLVSPPTANKVFQPGISFALVDVSISPIDGTTSCNFGFDVDGTTATIHPGQICTLVRFIVDPLNPATMTPTAWRFTQLGPNIAEEVGSASLTNIPLQDNTTGISTLFDCDYSLMARLSRVATD
jgi:hypothetical protein